MADVTKYTSTEIAKATGLTRGTVVYRASKLQIHLPCNYEEIKDIMSFKPFVPGAKKQRVNDLKRKLMTDGYQVSK